MLERLWTPGWRQGRVWTQSNAAWRAGSVCLSYLIIPTLVYQVPNVLLAFQDKLIKLHNNPVS